MTPPKQELEPGDAAIPRISIVTPCLNRVRFVADAVESVLAQNYPNVEHLVVDGGSTDGTLELLARWPHLRVISEPDESLYDALNKGIRLATGEIIGHLNTDDLYAPDIFAEVAKAFADPQIDAVYGGAEIFENEGGGERVVRRFSEISEIELSVRNATFGACLTNARFFRRRVYDRAGFVDLRYRIAADRDFLLRVALARPRAALLDRIVYRYRMHAGSLTITRNETAEARTRAECIAIAEEFLAGKNLDSEARYWCSRWHERETAQAAMRAAMAGNWRAAFDFARRGMHRSAMWPIMFARHVAGEARDRIFRRER